MGDSWRKVVLWQHALHLILRTSFMRIILLQNEPNSEGGWEQLRWGYERLRESIKDIDYDVIVIMSPHWQTYIGTHFLGVEKFQSKSVDPIFPNLFRYNYNINVDVELAKSIHDQAKSDGLSVKMMENLTLELIMAQLFHAT